MQAQSVQVQAAKLAELHDILQKAIEELLLPSKTQHDSGSVVLGIRTLVASMEHRLGCLLDVIGYSAADEQDGSKPHDC